MSGGFFNHSQYNLDQISADIEDEHLRSKME